MYSDSSLASSGDDAELTNAKQKYTCQWIRNHSGTKSKPHYSTEAHKIRAFKNIQRQILYKTLHHKVRTSGRNRERLHFKVLADIGRTDKRC